MEELLVEARERLENTPKVIVDNDSCPLLLVGDLHGDPSVFSILSEFLGDVKAVFLGDYADRGRYQRETLEALFTTFLEHPEDVLLLRGNHEPGPSSHPLYSGHPHPYDVVEVLTPSELLLYERLHVELPLVYYNPHHRVVAVHGFLSSSLLRSLPDIPWREHFIHILWSDSDPLSTHFRGIDVPDPWDWGWERVEDTLEELDFHLFKGHSPQELGKSFRRIHVFFGHCIDTGGYYRYGVRYAVVGEDIKTVESIPCGSHGEVLSSLRAYLKSILR